MPRTVRVVFGLPILFTTVTKTWRAFMSAYLHGQPSLRAVFFRLQVVLHEQDCIQIKTIGQWPVFELQSTKNIFEDSLKNIRKTHHLNFTSFTTCRAIIFVLFAFISPKWKPYAFTEPSLGSKLRISPEISVSVSISSPRSEAMNWSNNGCSGQWPRLTTNNAQSITVSENGSLRSCSIGINRFRLVGLVELFCVLLAKNRLLLVWLLNFFNPHQTGLKRLKKHW